MSENKVYQVLAISFQSYQNCVAIQAYQNCVASGSEWKYRHEKAINYICGQLPSGSGIDKGTKFNFEKSKPNRLVLNVDFHHMENGHYDGWTEHEIIITPDLAYNFDLRITGRDRNQIKDYLGDTYHYSLSRPTYRNVLKSKELDFPIIVIGDCEPVADIES
jgi:hypothetical protein